MEARNRKLSEWYAFFTDRYENSAATHAFADFSRLRAIIQRESRPDGVPYSLADVPIFADHTLAEAENWLRWNGLNGPPLNSSEIYGDYNDAP